MTTLAFPEGFLWGTATSAHQVEGHNSGSDWWEWELRPGTPCREPSGAACDHYHRYGEDVALLAGLGFNCYRFGIEWARIEPEPGRFDADQLAHYVRLTDTVRHTGLEPVVTLNHFTLPLWLGQLGGWEAVEAPAWFGRYCRRVVETLGDRVRWYCTINEPGIVAIGGYLGALGFPPGRSTVASWQRAIAALCDAHRRARAAIKELQPQSRVGATHSMQEWEATPGGHPIMEYLRRHMEDVFLEASSDDDFIGVQTYTRARVEVPRLLAPLARAVVHENRIARAVLARLIPARAFGTGVPEGARRTQMGYEYRPEAVAATISRVAALLPGRPILVTEHGIATDDDLERVEFITTGLTAIHALIATGIPVLGYIHWSAMDNFEWVLGYDMRFGLIAVDRVTQRRDPKPSAHYLGEIARSGRMEV